MIELTQQQQQAVKEGDVVRLSAPDIGEDIVVLTAAQYENLCESLADQREQRGVLRYSMKQARKVAEDNPY